MTSSDVPPTAEDRLDALEAADGRWVAERALDRRFELFEAILLSIAAVLAAWAGFQSAKWSGEQDDSYNRANAARVESTRASSNAGQQKTVDVVTFTQWLQAGEQEGAFDAPKDGELAYVPDPAALSGFLYERFRPEFKVAVDAWVASDPLGDPDAPPTPFEMPAYRNAQADRAARLEAEAERHAAIARTDNERGDDYVLMTIVFATVLFFAGISSKMDTFRARAFLLTTATVLLAGAFVLVLSFPKQL